MSRSTRRHCISSQDGSECGRRAASGRTAAAVRGRRRGGSFPGADARLRICLLGVLRIQEPAHAQRTDTHQG